MKKIESTFWIEEKYIHRNGTEQTAKVTLVVNYQLKSYSIKPSISSIFKFENGHEENFNLRIAVVKCIEKALHLAKEELDFNQ